MPTPTPTADRPSPEEAAAEKQAWIDHVSRTTAVLAVLAALSSGQYAGKFSSTILAQAEASDQWSYYQAKSIKKHLSEGQLEIATILAAGRPELASAVAQLQDSQRRNAKKYEDELARIKAQAEATEALKRRHQRQGDRFQYAFVVLQAGVVLSTIAASARRKELWVFAILAGAAGLLMVANGFLLVV
ncbi:MAG: hypothetical protein NVS4B10_18470 [Myxococcales bacterium]